ncbi:hypothetical protein D1231_17035 [Henriciella mobilis]|nr:hypothetical protein D1231_17035 [Henriciella mobilis]
MTSRLDKLPVMSFPLRHLQDVSATFADHASKFRSLEVEWHGLTKKWPRPPASENPGVEMP